MKFKIIVRETLEREVEVDAEDLEDAFDKVEEKYDEADELVLDSEDHTTTELVYNNHVKTIVSNG